MVLMDRFIPFLAAFVGLIALGGAVIVELEAQRRAELVSQQLAGLGADVERLSLRTEALASAADDGTAAGLLALQDRMNALEKEWGDRRVAGPNTAIRTLGGAAAPQSTGAAAAVGPSLPSLPAEDCIPQGTRFMAVTGESYTICQSPAVVRVNGITADNVAVEGAGVITETGFANLAGTTCTLMVFSADIEGFAEMRVNCT